ncbi:MAG: hypothetical protein HUJ16_04120 [Kangiella sp.]|nr:hypothetical protein [Kangiella sp.]
MIDSKNLEFVNTFNDIKIISTYIFNKFHGNDISEDDDNGLINSFCKSSAHDELFNNIELRKVASLSYLVSAYYISKVLQSDTKRALVEEYLKEANILYKAKALTDISYIKFRKSIASDYKNTLNDLKKLRKQIRNKIHHKIISPLKIDGQHLITFLSIFSATYFCLSYLYLSNYLTPFGIKTSDYFYISDYFSASLNSLVGVMISVLLSVFALVFGMTNAVNIVIDEVDTGKKPSRLLEEMFTILLILNTFVSLLYFFFADAIPSDILRINIYMLILFFISKVPIEKYFSNHVSIRIFCFVLVVSVFYVHAKAHKAVQNVLSNQGERQISIEYEDIDLSEHELRHLVNTTDYSIYWCYNHKESIVVSKSKLTSIRIPSN